MKITGRQWLILLSVQFTTVLFGLTATSVTVILPQLKGALSATQEQISWVLTFNLVATAIATPLTGWLAARLGWRTLMVLSAVGFTAASMLCGLVNSLEGLLALRVVQGAFGAPIFPMGQTIVLTSFHRSQHPFILMMWGVGGVMGPILGPTFGGLITDYMSWRWTFFLIVPLGMVAAGLAFAALNDDEKGRPRPFDYHRLRLHRDRHRRGPAAVRPRPAQRLVRIRARPSPSACWPACSSPCSRSTR